MWVGFSTQWSDSRPSGILGPSENHRFAPRFPVEHRNRGDDRRTVSPVRGTQLPNPHGDGNEGACAALDTIQWVA